jgi:hypothetical protein
MNTKELPNRFRRRNPTSNRHEWIPKVEALESRCVLSTFIFGINPKATYLRTNQDSGSLDTTPIRLSSLGIRPGDFVFLQRLGFWHNGNNPPGDSFSAMTGVFSATDILLPSTEANRVRDAMHVGEWPFVTLPTHRGGLPTDIQEDFAINPYVGHDRIALQVPVGAAFLFVAAPDTLYGDNKDPNGDYALRITSFYVTTSTFIPANHVVIPYPACGIPPLVVFAGDDRGFSPTSDSFRTRQLALKADHEPNKTGPTKEYAMDALRDGVINRKDDDGSLNDCHLLHDVDKASNAGMFINVSAVDNNALTVRMFGGAGNPLVPSPEISWDFEVSIVSKGMGFLWQLEGNHDCFPAFEIYVGTHPIYLYDPGPPPYPPQDVLNCLRPPLDIPVRRSGILPEGWTGLFSSGNAPNLAESNAENVHISVTRERRTYPVEIGGATPAQRSLADRRGALPVVGDETHPKPHRASGREYKRLPVVVAGSPLNKVVWLVAAPHALDEVG